MNSGIRRNKIKFLSNLFNRKSIQIEYKLIKAIGQVDIQCITRWDVRKYFNCKMIKYFNNLKEGYER